MKNKIILIVGLISCLVLGFVIGRLWPRPVPEVDRGGLMVHALVESDEDSRGFKLSSTPIVTAEHILWYDWKSNIFALDVEMLDVDVFADALSWDGYRRLAVTVDGVVVHGIRYADIGMSAELIPEGELTIYPDKVLFYGDVRNLGGHDGSVARIYSIDRARRIGTLNTRIYYELLRAGRLLEQINNRYILTEIDHIVGQSVQSRFFVESVSVVTFEPTRMRAYHHDPLVVEVTNLRTRETVFEFTHFFSTPVSFIMDAGEYGIYVSGGGFVNDTYIVSGIAIPEL